MLEQGEEGALATTLAEVKAYLRIGGSEDDALIAGLVRGAMGVCEQFVGQWLIARDATETLPALTSWQKLSARPVRAILGVDAVDAAGTAGALTVDAYAIDIDAAGDGWVRATRILDERLLRVRYRAGLAEEMNGLPEAIRQGIVRLAAEHFGARDGNSATPPAVVGALWRPWRRMRLA